MRSYPGSMVVAGFVATLLLGSGFNARFLRNHSLDIFSPLAEESLYPSEKSVRGELIRLQRDQGLTIAFNEDGLNLVSFERRFVTTEAALSSLSEGSSGAVSPDGRRVAGFLSNASGLAPGTLGIVDSDGTHLETYPGIKPIDFCWSNDSASLALTTSHGWQNADLQILNVKTKAAIVIPTSVVPGGHFGGQCWSPDNAQIVLDNMGIAQIYDLGTNKIQDLVKGQNPTWSPDGQWIAVRDGDVYYRIRPSGLERERLFKKKNATSGLFWSPDSRYVAYVKEGNFLEQFPIIDAEVYILRVRRLEDGSEDWVAKGVSCCINYQWVQSKELLSIVKSQGVK